MCHGQQSNDRDEQTGRIMDGRRYSDGLHQAIEAKENVKMRPLPKLLRPSHFRTISECMKNCLE